MSNLTLPTTPKWNENINQVETNESILGGANGNANLATRQLAENILWLKLNMQAYKVGDIYTTTISHTDAAAVAAHHGYGTWERYAEGRTLVGFSTITDDPIEYKTMGNEFGENKHTLTIEQIPSHAHDLGISAQTRVSHDDSQETDRPVDATGEKDSGYVGNTGGGEAHNNIQPSKVVGQWLRIS